MGRKGEGGKSEKVLCLCIYICVCMYVSTYVSASTHTKSHRTPHPLMTTKTHKTPNTQIIGSAPSASPPPMRPSFLPPPELDRAIVEVTIYPRAPSPPLHDNDNKPALAVDDDKGGGG